MPPGHYFHLQSDKSAAQAPFVRKQAAFLYAKDFREELNLLVGDNGALRLDVGEDVAGHVAPKKLQFSHKLVLRPTALITKLCDVLANNILVAVHKHLQKLQAGLHGDEQQEGPRKFEPNQCRDVAGG
jgi:hypothetical protein